MKTTKMLLTLVVFVLMGLTVNAQAKKDTTVIFKVGVHCLSCKAKLDKNMPFEKGVKDYKLNMKDSTLLLTYRVDKNSLAGLKAAIEKHDVQVLAMCDKEGKVIKCKGHKCCQKEVKEGCKSNCGGCDKNKKDEKCKGKCGDNCCSKTGNKDACCKKK